jgi:hypothetical protein
LVKINFSVGAIATDKPLFYLFALLWFLSAAAVLTLKTGLPVAIMLTIACLFTIVTDATFVVRQPDLLHAAVLIRSALGCCLIVFLAKQTSIGVKS